MHFRGAESQLLTACLYFSVYLSSTFQRAAENGFAADDGSVSGDGRSFRCCTVGELLRDRDCVSAMAVTLVCDEKGFGEINARPVAKVTRQQTGIQEAYVSLV